MDMALGDIIKSSSNKGNNNKRNTNKRGGRGGGRSRGGGRGGGNSGGGYGAQRGNQDRRQQRQQSTPYQRAPAPQQQGPKLGATTKIMVSNLDPEVVAEDVEEIFDKIGQVKEANIFYDRDGNSMGTAEVTFYKSADAMRAVEDYDGAKVDGRPMYLKLIANRIEQKSVVPRQQPQQRRQPQQQQRAPAARQQRQPRGGKGGKGANGGKGAGRGGKGGKREPKGPAPTNESLDAEMDAYFNKKDQAPAATEAAPAKSSFTGQPE